MDWKPLFMGQKTLRGERQPAPDQADLARFKICA